jgi:hypothetical protein
MKRYITYPKASTDQHAGCFWWHTFRWILEIYDDDSVTMHTEILSPGTSRPDPEREPVFSGSIVAKPKQNQMTIHLTRPESQKRLKFYAIEADDLLICELYSEFNERSQSELFKRD